MYRIIGVKNYEMALLTCFLALVWLWIMTLFEQYRNSICRYKSTHKPGKCVGCSANINEVKFFPFACRPNNKRQLIVATLLLQTAITENR